jgi:hypothetical protein
MFVSQNPIRDWEEATGTERHRWEAGKVARPCHSGYASSTTSSSESSSSCSSTGFFCSSVSTTDTESTIRHHRNTPPPRVSEELLVIADADVATDTGGWRAWCGSPWAWSDGNIYLGWLEGEACTRRWWHRSLASTRWHGSSPKHRHGLYLGLMGLDLGLVIFSFKNLFMVSAFLHQTIRKILSLVSVNDNRYQIHTIFCVIVIVSVDLADTKNLFTAGTINPFLLGTVSYAHHLPRAHMHIYYLGSPTSI